MLKWQLEDETKKLKKALRKFTDLCYRADTRAMRVDGPVGPTWQHVEPDELRDCYQFAMKVLEGKKK